MLTALTDSSAPWSMTFSTSVLPIKDSVNCKPPVPQPRAIGISRDAKGTWYPGIATAFSVARRISFLDPSSKNAKCGLALNFLHPFLYLADTVELRLERDVMREF